MENLFSYGTLQLEQVQLKNFGRKLQGNPDSAPGFKSGLVKIKDEEIIRVSGMTHHKNIIPTGKASDRIEGMVFRVTEEELKKADEYETPSGYSRIRVTLASGVIAWVYLGAGE